MKYILTQFLLWELIPRGSKMQTAFPYDAAIWGKKEKKIKVVDSKCKVRRQVK